ncbi:MAG: ATP-binding protein, partial [Patescibacteria group bacterium]
LTLALWLLVTLILGGLMAYSIILRRNLKVITIKNRKLQDVNRAKTKFVFFIVHQLRAPLSALRFSFLMFQSKDFGELNTQQTEIVQTSLKEIDNLLTMIEGLLDIPKIEQRRLPMNKTAISLQKFLSLVERFLQEFSPLIKQKNISFAYEAPPIQGKIFLEVDWSKIKQVLTNLLENALHYTKDNGRISLAITLEKSFLKIALTDSGIGIPVLEQVKLFKKFYRASNAKILSNKGTGIGLYLAKFMVEGHGGKIWFTSQEDRGAIFYFTLPLKATVEEFLKNI